MTQEIDHPAQLYEVPLRNRLARSIIRPVFRLIFHILAKIRIRGLENVPTQGAYLIAINHVSLFDPPFVIAFWPKCPEAAGAAEIWSKPGQSTLARLYGGIQVHRGQYDRQMIDTVTRVLMSGRPLVIAPEGGRSHQPGLQRGLPGVAFIMERLQVPVVPVGIVGTTDDFFQKAIHGKRPLLELNIGEPFTLPQIQDSGAARRTARQSHVDEVMYRIADLLPIEYQGMYAEKSRLAKSVDDPEHPVTEV